MRSTCIALLLAAGLAGCQPPLPPPLPPPPPPPPAAPPPEKKPRKSKDEDHGDQHNGDQHQGGDNGPKTPGHGGKVPPGKAKLKGEPG